MAIHPATKPGPIALTIADMERSLTYYQQHIGLQLLSRAGDTAVLGTPQRPLLHLRQRPDAPRRQRSTGLYHFALLLPSRHDLARVVHHFVTRNTPLDGMSDHAVSEALYLSDPDGNGIEIYADRPREAWPVVDGRLQMTTLPLDVRNLLNELGDREPPFTTLPPATVMGHVHLHVDYLDKAIRFYTETLGFDLIMRYGPSAAFVAAGGYHHHVGLNTWAGVAAPHPPAGAIGLRHISFLLPAAADLATIKNNLISQQIDLKEENGSLSFNDPAGNTILLSTAGFPESAI